MRKNVLNIPWSILNSKNIDGEKEKLYFGPIRGFNEPGIYNENLQLVN
jgi:hypothetical protein